jgi:hypothetical protein
MSLNKTLDRLFDEIRREAKRNPDFANRLDAVLRLHDSRRDVPDEVVDDIAHAMQISSPASAAGGDPGSSSGEPAGESPPSARAGAKKRAKAPPAINPAGVYKKQGEAGLTKALAGQDLSALRALVAEHNLDPGGITSSLTRAELAAHIVTQAKKRAERDEKMFDY